MIKTLLILISVCFITQGANWYVDTITTGSNSGMSWANAWQDFNSIAWTSMHGGDTIFISGAPDTTFYNQPANFNVAGSAGNPIVMSMSSDAGHNGYAKATKGLNLSYSRNYWDIRGKNRLIVMSTTVSGIKLYQSSNINISNLSIYGADTSVYYQHGISIEFGAFYINLDTIIIKGVTGDGININPALAVPEGFAGWNLFTINGCTIDSVADDGIQAAYGYTEIKNCFIRYVDTIYGGVKPHGGHPDGIQTGRTMHHYNIHNNTFVDCMQGVFLEGTGKDTSYIVNNLFYDTDKTPAVNQHRFISANKDSVQCTPHVVIANNTMYNSKWWAMYNSIWNFVEGDAIIRNNILVDCARWFGGTTGYDTAQIQSDNICYTSGTGQPSLESPPAGVITTNPILVDTANHNLAVTNTSSSAYLTGTDLSIYFNTDYNYGIRNSWDIGAYNIGGAAPIAKRKCETFLRR